MAKRVFLVDDHEPWRRHIRSLLRTSGGWQIVGEAAEGLEAVHRAATLAPDLILLDVELPALNGLEVARRILAVAPSARVLFVSSHRSWEIAEAAFGTGARGYLLKSHAGEELLPAMNTIVRGRRFISAAFLGSPVEDRPRSRRAARHHRHEVGFYSQHAFLLDDFTEFAEGALNDGKAVIVATIASRRDDLQQRLQARVDLDLAVRQGRYLWVDEAEAVSPLMVDGSPDETTFWKNATSMVIQAAQASRCDPPRVAACGECSDQLLQAGNLEAAIRLEHLWDELTSVFNMDVLCGYSMTAPRHDDDRGAFDRICAEHTAVRTR